MSELVLTAQLANSRPATDDPFVSGILERVATVLPPQDRPYALHEPRIGGKAWDYVKDCLDSGWVSSVGDYVRWFEEMLATNVGAGHAIATVNGTAALHTCLLLAGVEPGDEVLVPSLTFVATGNAVRYCGAEPHFVDSEPVSLGVDPQRLASYLDEIAEMRGGTCYNRSTDRPIRALIVVHLYGHPAQADELADLAEAYNLAMIEDAAEALGTFLAMRHVGRSGMLSAFSFNGNKTVTTGGGGAIVTDDPLLAERARHLTTTARIEDAGVMAHDAVAFNYRMPNLNAALGCAQLEDLPDMLASKRRLADQWRAAFTGHAGVQFLDEPRWGESNFWLNALILDPARTPSRPMLIAALQAAGVHCRPFFTPLHRLPMYTRQPRMDLSVAQDMEMRGLCLPSSAGIVK